VTDRPQTSRSVSWKVVVTGFLLVVPLVWLLWRGLSLNPHHVDSPLVGNPAPAFALPRLLDGALVSRASLTGKPTVVNFIQGAVKIPEGFENVKTARFGKREVTFVSVTGKEVTVQVDHAFLKTGEL